MVVCNTYNIESLAVSSHVAYYSVNINLMLIILSCIYNLVSPLPWVDSDRHKGEWCPDRQAGILPSCLAVCLALGVKQVCAWVTQKESQRAGHNPSHLPLRFD